MESGGLFKGLADIGFWLRSARADASLKRLRAGRGDAEAFDLLYGQDIDPWGFTVPKYSYQRRKYDALVALLPKRRFGAALDLGCGIGLLSERLAPHCDSVLGLDVSRVAVDAAAKRLAARPGLSFAQADVTALDPGLDGRFDLVVVADVLYYLQPMSDATLKAMALRIGALLAPGGLCLLANHFFFDIDPDSRLSRRIHQAFAWSPAFELESEHRRAFFLASLLTRAR